MRVLGLTQPQVWWLRQVPGDNEVTLGRPRRWNPRRVKRKTFIRAFISPSVAPPLNSPWFLKDLIIEVIEGLPRIVSRRPGGGSDGFGSKWNSNTDWGHLSSEAAERQNNEGADEDTTNPNYEKTAILIGITDNDLLFAVKKTVVKSIIVDQRLPSFTVREFRGSFMVELFTDHCCWRLIHWRSVPKRSSACWGRRTQCAAELLTMIWEVCR